MSCSARAMGTKVNCLIKIQLSILNDGCFSTVVEIFLRGIQGCPNAESDAACGIQMTFGGIEKK
jgi:hypothetical protein